MKTLSIFLAERIIDRQDYRGFNAEKEYQDMIKWYAEDLAIGLEAYKKHLQNDSPKIVQWSMVEKQLISALERMQSCDHQLKYKCQDCGFEFYKPKILKFLLSADALACPKCDSQKIQGEFKCHT